MDISVLKSGDVLCVISAKDRLKTLQGALKMFSGDKATAQGNADCVHIGMVASPYSPDGMLGLVDAKIDGFCYRQLDVAEGNTAGLKNVEVFRYKGRGRGLYTREAARIARNWCIYGEEYLIVQNVWEQGAHHKGRGDSLLPSSSVRQYDTYSVVKALKCPLGSARYGSRARERAQRYHNSPDAPPFSTNDPSRSERMFCSMFIVAAWQAAVGPDKAATIMGRDAAYTSPVNLHGYLVGNTEWQSQGFVMLDL